MIWGVPPFSETLISRVLAFSLWLISRGFLCKAAGWFSRRVSFGQSRRSQEWLGAILGHPWKTTHCLRPAPLTQGVHVSCYISYECYEWNNLNRLYMIYVPSREWSHIPPFRKKENHQLKTSALGKGYVSSQDGNTLITCQVGTMTMNLEPLNHALVEKHFLNGIKIYIYIHMVFL